MLNRVCLYKSTIFSNVIETETSLLSHCNSVFSANTFYFEPLTRCYALFVIRYARKIQKKKKTPNKSDYDYYRMRCLSSNLKHICVMFSNKSTDYVSFQLLLMDAS